MIKCRAIAALLGIVWGGAAIAQTSTVPAPLAGFGTLTVVNASALLSTLTVGPTDGTLPRLPVFPPSQMQMIYVINSPSSAGILYLCPLGGTCSATVGIPIAVGSSYGCFRCLPSMTVIAATTATAIGQW